MSTRIVRLLVQPLVANADVEEMKLTSPNQTKNTRRGFRVSDQPVVESNPPAARSSSETSGELGELPSSYGQDLLYVIARDPKSLFLYWDLDWKRVFAQAGVSARQIHLRIFRANGSIEATREIDPFTGHCYAEVSTPGDRYYCELGCFDGDDWKYLVRSATIATPDGEMSEDLSADFATLPLHLSFQRLLDMVGTTITERSTLAENWQKRFRTWDANREVFLWPENWIEPERRGASELAWLLATEKSKAHSAISREMLEGWATSSWGIAASSLFGQSSRA